MRYADLFQVYRAVPVTSPPVRRQEEAPAAPAAPAAGARWGRASAFTWSRAAAGRDQPGLTVEFPEPAPREFMRVVDAQAKIMSQTVRVEAPDDPSRWVEVDRITRMAFAYTEFPPKRHLSSPQPSRTTVYDLAFDLYPPDEVVV